LAIEELEQFLRERCKERGLSLRKLSINAGLSPGTVHNIIKRQYQPTVFSLNRLADYLGVKRQYLWQLAGLLEDMDYNSESTFSNPRLRFLFAQVDRLPETAKDLIIDIIQDVIAFYQRADRPGETPPRE
jgi:transcriptional regulator with XRE-family HTH domain